MSREAPGHTLQPPALVHEAFLKLINGEAQEWSHRGHFFAAAAEAMRRILVDRARRYAAEKHGANRERVDIDLDELSKPVEDQRGHLALDVALERFEQEDPGCAEVVKLRYFAGLTIEQTAEVLGSSPATVKRQWTCARIWLYQAMTEGRDGRS